MSGDGIDERRYVSDDDDDDNSDSVSFDSMFFFSLKYLIFLIEFK